MNKSLLFAAGALISTAILNSSICLADKNVSDRSPVEIYTCKYNDGMGEKDLDKVIANWNEWANQQKLKDYSAWTLVPFYSGPDQDFDYIWMGASSTGRALGAAQDAWLADGGAIAAEFEAVSTCNSHFMYKSIQFKKPTKTEDPSRAVIAFKACNIREGKTFQADVAPALSSWASIRESEGSTAGFWVHFPLFGGGDEFDLFFVGRLGNLEKHGLDFDRHNDQKSIEILDQVLECQSTSPVYIATLRREGLGSDN